MDVGAFGVQGAPEENPVQSSRSGIAVGTIRSEIAAGTNHSGVPPETARAEMIVPTARAGNLVGGSHAESQALRALFAALERARGYWIVRGC